MNLHDDHPLNLMRDLMFEGDESVEIRALRKGEPAHVWYCRADQLESQIPTIEMVQKHGRDVYVGISPRRPGLEHGHAGTQYDVMLARTLWVDLDDGCTIDEARRLIVDACLPAPTALVHSGSGVHIYWRLSEPLRRAPVEWEEDKDGKLVPTAESVAAVKADDLETEWRGRMRALIQAINTAAGRRVADTGIHDVPRIMRAWGTRNMKHSDGRKCHAVEREGGRVYDLSEFPEAEALREHDFVIVEGDGTEPLHPQTMDFMRNGAPEGTRHGRTFAAFCDLFSKGYGEQTGEWKAVFDSGVAIGLEPDDVSQRWESATSKPRGIAGKLSPTMQKFLDRERERQEHEPVTTSKIDQTIVEERPAEIARVMTTFGSAVKAPRKVKETRYVIEVADEGAVEELIDNVAGILPVGVVVFKGGYTTGKSLFLAHLASLASRGEGIQRMRRREQTTADGSSMITVRRGQTCYLSMEAGWTNQTKPRLVAADADMNKVFRIVTEREFEESPDHDGADVVRAERIPPLDRGGMDVVVELIRQRNAMMPEWPVRYLPIDPITSFMSGEFNPNDGTQVRRFLEDTMLPALEPLGITAILVMHHSKATGRGEGAKALGSSEWLNVPRCVYTFFEDPDYPRPEGKERLLCALPSKGSNEGVQAGLRFTSEGVPLPGKKKKYPKLVLLDTQDPRTAADATDIIEQRHRRGLRGWERAGFRMYRLIDEHGGWLLKSEIRALMEAEGKDEGEREGIWSGRDFTEGLAMLYHRGVVVKQQVCLHGTVFAINDGHLDIGVATAGLASWTPRW